MTHQTRLMPTFVSPVARSIATRARVFGVFIGFMTALVLLGEIGLVTVIGDARMAVVFVSMITISLGLWTVMIFRFASRAARLAKRATDPDARFVMETTRMGELGMHGGVIPGTAIRITAEQFTHLLSTPRPALDAASAVAPMDPDRLPRAVVRSPRD